MSGSTTAYSPSLSSAASAAISSQAASVAGAGSSALGQLSSNYNDFLQMLMTQLQNQDPSNPMDANTFTQELVQFSGVEQQINTNTSLTQLIQLTQETGLEQSSALVGKQVAVSGSDMTVQNGQGSIQFTAAGNQTVAISVHDTNGNLLDSTTVNASQGTNTWTWNAKSSKGVSEPDGDYQVSISTATAGGTATSVPFNAIGTVTGVVANGGTLDLQMGKVSAPVSNVQSVLATAPAA